MSKLFKDIRVNYMVVIWQLYVKLIRVNQCDSCSKIFSVFRVFVY